MIMDSVIHSTDTVAKAGFSMAMGIYNMFYSILFCHFL